MKRIAEHLESLYKTLVNEESVTRIFNVEDCKKKDEDFASHDVFKDIDMQKVLISFKESISYLKKYAYKSQNQNGTIGKIKKDIFDLSAFFQQDNVNFSTNDMDLRNKVLLLKVQCLCLMYAVSSTLTENVKSLIDQNLDLLKIDLGNVFYRGQNDTSFKLLPSIFRNYSITKYGRHFTAKTLFQIYDDSELVKKYSQVFSSSKVDVNFCSYMQHSCSFSPLLDLTTNHTVALTFATVKTSDMNSYMSKSSAIYRFEFNDTILESSDEDIFNMDIYIIENKLRPFSLFKNKLLFYCIPSDFDPVVRVISERQSNDRMKYQKGAFLFFKSCVIVNGNILLPYKIGNITKYEITSNVKDLLSKTSIYSRIEKNKNYYDYEHLMNPYLYFDETPFR